ncbi:MAG: pantoate--beta-alanine ligase [Pseudomonadota bacterium]
MQTVHALPALRAILAVWRQAGQRIALVPTMGNLHAGHRALVLKARTLADRVVATIFVNPMQFGPLEDLAAYPKTLAADQDGLAAAGADLLFTPAVVEIYPQGLEHQTRVEVPGLSSILCGASRPGHFAGVATVVCKLFNMAQPDLALFGEKDFQQLLVIRRMAQDLAFPVEIIGYPTVREADGLAMSSRNGYLTPEERARAPCLFATLQQSAQRILAGGDLARVTHDACGALAAGGLKPEYVAIRRAADLGEPGADDQDLVILAAAWLGRTRLIDNLQVISGKPNHDRRAG